MIGLFASWSLAMGQTSGGSGGGGGATGGGGTAGGGTGGGTTGGGTATGSTRSPTNPNTQRTPDFVRPIFLAGRVLTESGTPPPEPAHIERVCSGQTFTEGFTNAKGDFSFIVGQNNGTFADASQSQFDSFGSSRNGSDPFGGGGGAVGPSGSRQVTERDLWNCEIRASLVGYRSQMISLAGRRFMDNPDLGTIIIRKIGAIEGRSISMANETAPKDAKKAYQKGVEFLRKGKAEEGEKSLDKALSIYPTYPQALYERGKLHLAQGKREEARQDFNAAIAVDAKLEQPYVQLTAIDYLEQKWDAALADSEKLLRLNPYDYPNVYMIRGIALMSNKQFDEAEKVLRNGLRQDMNNAFPGLNHVLGAVLAEKQDFKGAADALKEYLRRAPKANNAELVRKQLAELEQSISQNKVPATAQP